MSKAFGEIFFVKEMALYKENILTKIKTDRFKFIKT